MRVGTKPGRRGALRSSGEGAGHVLAAPQGVTWTCYGRSGRTWSTGRGGMPTWFWGLVLVAVVELAEVVGGR
jgi:hypothetical protein